MGRSEDRDFWYIGGFVAIAVAAGVAAWTEPSGIKPPAAMIHESRPVTTAADGMVRIAAGRVQLGEPAGTLADAYPPVEVEIDAFWLDTHLVTNAQFAEFVRQTRYLTTAEQFGSGSVFRVASASFETVPGATWRRPDGPDSSIVARDQWPVVQVSWHDAQAYAEWAGKRLVTEAEYEYAARSRRLDCRYAWGREETPHGKYRANSWQGHLYDIDLKLDGYSGRSPVDAFPPNDFGLYDITGNVWCWCADWYAADAYAQKNLVHSGGPATGVTRVRRGGSWLSPSHGRFAIHVAESQRPA